MIEVSEAKIYPRQESFSLLFEMTENVAPVQGNYQFEHERIGINEIFVVPIEQNANGFIFEAVFNRRTKQD